MDLDDLRLLLRTAEEGSISRAARALAMSQPNASRRLQRLEREVGRPLLDRQTTPLVPTAAGLKLLAFARDTLQRWEALTESLAGPEGLTGELRLAASTAPSAGLVSRLAAAFLGAHPGVHIHLATLDSRAVEAAVVARHASLGFIGCRPRDPSLRYAAVADDEILLLVPDRPPFADLPDPLPRDRLAGLPLVVREEGSCTQKTAFEALERVGCAAGRFRVVLEVDSHPALLAAVASGAGAGFASAAALHEMPGQGIRALHVAGANLSRHLYLIYDPAEPRRDAVAAAFIAFALSSGRHTGG
ncbi:MAG: LysR family transcriptional regulator [Firmicutes bacterium]|nr:LysR family transcriptional regulator [Bacillota bacterium]